jgi:hypothetical protein
VGVLILSDYLYQSKDTPQFSKCFYVQNNKLLINDEKIYLGKYPIETSVLSPILIVFVALHMELQQSLKSIFQEQQITITDFSPTEKGVAFVRKGPLSINAVFYSF